MYVPRHGLEIIWIYSARKAYSVTAYPAMELVSLLVVSQSFFPLTGEQWWWSPHEEKLKESEFYFLLLLHRAFLSIWGGGEECMWVERMGFWDIGLETNSSQEICTNLLMTLSCPLVRNKSYLCYAFTCPPGIPVSPKVSITENSLYEKQKITKTEKSLMQVSIIFFCVLLLAWYLH